MPPALARFLVVATVEDKGANINGTVSTNGVEVVLGR
jgi:hypothetical protein